MDNHEKFCNEINSYGTPKPKNKRYYKNKNVNTGRVIGKHRKRANSIRRRKNHCNLFGSNTNRIWRNNYTTVRNRKVTNKTNSSKRRKTRFTKTKRVKRNKNSNKIRTRNRITNNDNENTSDECKPGSSSTAETTTEQQNPMAFLGIRMGIPLRELVDLILECIDSFKEPRGVSIKEIKRRLVRCGFDPSIDLRRAFIFGLKRGLIARPPWAIKAGVTGMYVRGITAFEFQPKAPTLKLDGKDGKVKRIPPKKPKKKKTGSRRGRKSKSNSSRRQRKNKNRKRK